MSRKDPIPTIPGMFLGFHHPKGEKHIQSDGSWLSCPGDDNDDKRCSRGAVPTILSGRLSDHGGMFEDSLSTFSGISNVVVVTGPYDGIKITCKV